MSTHHSPHFAGVTGTVYLIHFDTPYRHARHYIGWASCLPARLAEHQAGNGARLMQVIADAGITWRLARTWAGDRNLERKLKNRHGASRFCPICQMCPAGENGGVGAA